MVAIVRMRIRVVRTNVRGEIVGGTTGGGICGLYCLFEDEFMEYYRSVIRIGVRVYMQLIANPDLQHYVTVAAGAAGFWMSNHLGATQPYRDVESSDFFLLSPPPLCAILKAQGAFSLVSAHETIAP